jgi:hypothetical protein
MERQSWLDGRTLLLALAVLYSGLLLAFTEVEYKSDSGRYLKFATNLAQGFYSPREELDLTNGPGYPLVLAPLPLLGLPWSVAKVFNLAFLLAATAYVTGTVRLYLPDYRAPLAGAAVGLYPPALVYASSISSEPITLFLVAGLGYHLCRAHRDSSLWQAAGAAAFFGYLALTKIFFGYVIATALVAAVLLLVWRRSPWARRNAVVAALALVLCVPWLVYTYSLTGKVFYWGTPGGDTLYWMATPFPDEYGDWFARPRRVATPAVQERHGLFIDSMRELPDDVKDRLFREKALEYIRANPAKFAYNWAMNVTRMLFNYPYSFTPQKPGTFLYLLPNMIVLPLAVAALAVWAVRFRRVPAEIWSLGFLIAVSLGGSSLVSAEGRQFMVLLPWVLACTGFVLGTQVRWRFAD